MENILSTLNNYSNLISLVMSTIAVVIAITSLIRTRNSEKAAIKLQIREKEAELYSIRSVYFNKLTEGIGLPGREEMRVKEQALEKQIEYLKRIK